MTKYDKKRKSCQKCRAAAAKQGIFAPRQSRATIACDSEAARRIATAARPHKSALSRDIAARTLPARRIALSPVSFKKINDSEKRFAYEGSFTVIELLRRDRASRRQRVPPRADSGAAATLVSFSFNRMIL